jgi:hypothetical protein
MMMAAMVLLTANPNKRQIKPTLEKPSPKVLAQMMSERDAL